MNTNWQSTNTPPPDGEVVMTKIDDADGCRNEQALMLRGRMWYVPDESMYVYYRPTHWRELTGPERTYERLRLQSRAEELERKAQGLRTKV